MEQEIITVYCLIDEYLKTVGIKDDIRAIQQSNQSTSIGGFLMKLKLFLTAYSIDRFLKLGEEKQKLVLTSNLGKL